MLSFKRRKESRSAIPAVVSVNGRDYALHIRRYDRSRSITLRTDPAIRAIKVTCPPYVPIRQVTDFIIQKSDWIEKSFAKAGPLRKLEPGAVFPFRGRDITIVWREDLPRRVHRADSEIRVGGPIEGAGKRVTAWLKKQARNVLAADIAEYSEAAGELCPSLALSSARRRWGSCSSDGKIRINWRLIMAPDDVRRSVVAHEIAHMRHMNHSPNFYAWLDQIFEGDRKAADGWLKQHGSSLYSVSAE